MSHTNVESLGCIPMDAFGGTGVSTAAATNVALINAYLEDNWRTSRQSLYFPGRGWLVNDTIDMQNVSGHALFGAGGQVLARPEDHYTTSVPQGGPVSRLVAANYAGGTASFPDGPIVRLRSYAPLIDGVVLQGLWHPDNLTTLTDGYPIVQGGSHTNDKRCEVGIELEGQTLDGAQGPGKLACPAGLTVLLCETAIKCIDTPTEDNADQLIIGRFVPQYCDVGLWSVNRQSLGHRFAYVDQLNCNTAFKFDAGGKLWCGTLVMSSDAETGLHLTGSDVNGINNDNSSFIIDNLIYDGNNPLVTSQAIKITPPAETASAGSINIGFLHVSPQRAANSPVHPLIVIDRFYGDINIYGGLNFYEGMIKFTGAAVDPDQFFPTIRIHNAKFKRGHNPAKIFTSDSSEYVQYEYRSCCEVDGDAGSINGGQFFPDFRAWMELNGATPIQAGGYIYRRGSLVAKSANYTATIYDEAIFMATAGTTLSLPTVLDVRGIIYHVRNTSGGNITIDPNGAELIDGAGTHTLPAGVRIMIQAGENAWFLI